MWCNRIPNLGRVKVRHMTVINLILEMWIVRTRLAA